MSQSLYTLIIEDDPDIARLVSIQIEELGGQVQVTDSIEYALKITQLEAFDLIVLDLSLPDGDGIDFCREFRQHNELTPLLMLTARSNELDRVLGLEMGADDYLSKPFGLSELKARIKALIRRSSRYQNASPNNHEELQLGVLRIQPQYHQAWLSNELLTLTSKEFELLRFFATHPEKVFTRYDLLNQIWGLDHEGYEHTVNSHLNRLRKKIEQNPSSPKIIETVWGVGYKLNPEGLLQEKR